MPVISMLARARERHGVASARLKPCQHINLNASISNTETPRTFPQLETPKQTPGNYPSISHREFDPDPGPFFLGHSLSNILRVIYIRSI